MSDFLFSYNSLKFPQFNPILFVVIEFVLNGLEKTLIQGKFNCEPSYVRYGKELVIFSSSISQTYHKLEICKEFFYTRGFIIDNGSYTINLLIGKEFQFVGFKFKFKVFGKVLKLFYYPSSSEISKLFIRLSKVFKRNCQIHFIKRCFTHVNIILYRWLNFYRIGYSKKIFRKISVLLWDYTSSYFGNVYTKLPEFRKKFVYNRKNRLARYIFRKHTKQFGRLKRWWCINEDIQSKNSNNLFLICPSQISILNPMIIVYRSVIGINGLNSFHPLDRLKLSKKALGWKFDYERRILNKTKGYCCVCSWILLSDNEFSNLLIFSKILRNLQFSYPFCWLCFRKILINRRSYIQKIA